MIEWIDKKFDNKKFRIAKCPCGCEPILCGEISADRLLGLRKTVWLACPDDDCEMQPIMLLNHSVAEAVAAWNAGVINLPIQTKEKNEQ